MNRLLVLFSLFLVLVTACENDETNSQKHMPVAKFTIDPDTVLMGETVYFNADSSFDKEDNLSSLQVEWSFFGNEEFTTTSLSKTTSFAYQDIGPFFPKLCVTDSDGMMDTVMNMVIVVLDKANKSPDPAYIFLPRDYETGVPYKNVTLKWAESLDKEHDSISYDVWFGSYIDKLKRLNYPITYQIGKYPSPSVYGDRDIRIYQMTFPVNLHPNQDYFWSIGSKDTNGNYTLKNIWRFSTGGPEN